MQTHACMSAMICRWITMQILRNLPYDDHAQHSKILCVVIGGCHIAETGSAVIATYLGMEGHLGGVALRTS